MADTLRTLYQLDIDRLTDTLRRLADSIDAHETSVVSVSVAETAEADEPATMTLTVEFLLTDANDDLRDALRYESPGGDDDD